MQKPKRDHLDASFLQKKKSFTWYWQKELRNIPRLWIYFLNLNVLVDPTEVLHTWYSLQDLFKNMQNLFNKYAEEREFHYSLPFWLLPKHVENPLEHWFPSKYPFKFSNIILCERIADAPILNHLSVIACLYREKRSCCRNRIWLWRKKKLLLKAKISVCRSLKTYSCLCISFIHKIGKF